MQSSNIHNYLSKLQENYSEIIKQPEKESDLLERIFSELLKKPKLNQGEKDLVGRLCNDVGNLFFYGHKEPQLSQGEKDPIGQFWEEVGNLFCYGHKEAEFSLGKRDHEGRLCKDVDNLLFCGHKTLTLAFQRYQQQILKTNSQGVLLLTKTPPLSDFSRMSNEDILKHFNIDKSIKEKSARDILCNYIKNLTNPNLPPSPLNFSDLQLKMLPKCFLTDPFFSDMQINMPKEVFLPPNIKISEIRNLNVYTQVIRQTAFEKVFGSKDASQMIFDYLTPKDLENAQSASMEMDTNYQQFRENVEVVKKAQKGNEKLEFTVLNQKEWNKRADEIHQENLFFLTDLQKAGHIDQGVNINALSRLECLKMAQEIESLQKAFPSIARALGVWIVGEKNVSEIRDILHREEAKVSTVKTLNLNDLSLKCIPPEIKLFTGLTKLDLSCNKISDLTHLEHLTALTELRLYENKISDLTPLANLTALHTLYLRMNQISELLALANLPALRDLSLDSNQISNLTSLATLTALTRLALNNNQISDLTPLEKLTALDILGLNNNRISDLTPIANLTALTRLHLAQNQISDLPSLANLTALKQLYLCSNQISDLSHFLQQNHPNLQDLLILSENAHNLNKFLLQLKERFPRASIS